MWKANNTWNVSMRPQTNKLSLIVSSPRKMMINNQLIKWIISIWSCLFFCTGHATPRTLCWDKICLNPPNSLLLYARKASFSQIFVPVFDVKLSQINSEVAATKQLCLLEIPTTESAQGFDKIHFTWNCSSWVDQPIWIKNDESAVIFLLLLIPPSPELPRSEQPWQFKQEQFPKQEKQSNSTSLLPICYFTFGLPCGPSWTTGPPLYWDWGCCLIWWRCLVTAYDNTRNNKINRKKQDAWRKRRWLQHRNNKCSKKIWMKQKLSKQNTWALTIHNRHRVYWIVLRITRPKIWRSRDRIKVDVRQENVK